MAKLDPRGGKRYAEVLGVMEGHSVPGPMHAPDPQPPHGMVLRQNVWVMNTQKTHAKVHCINRLYPRSDLMSCKSPTEIPRRPCKQRCDGSL